MSNEIREKDHEWVKAFLPQQRHSTLHTSRRQDSLPGFRHRKNPDERIQGGVQIQKKLTL